MSKTIVFILALLTSNCFGQSIWTKPGDIFSPGTNTSFTPVGVGHWIISSSGSGGGGSGTNGLNGTNATISIGATTTLPAGSSATVVNAGSSLNAILQFGIPKGADGTNGATGPQGPAGASGSSGTNATIQITNTITLPAGSSATVSNLGTPTDALIQFSIPQGYNGTNGSDGIASGKPFYPDPSIFSDVGGYYVMSESPSTNAETNITVTVSGTSDFLIGAFATSSNSPGVESLPAGVNFRHYYFSTGAANQVAKCRVETWKRNIAGSETLLRTGAYSPDFSDTVSYVTWQSTDTTNHAILSTDRLVYRIYVTKVSGPSSFDVSMYFNDYNHASWQSSTISSGAVGPQGPAGPSGAGTDLTLSDVPPYSSGTNFNIDFSIPSQTWTATNFAIRYSTNWLSRTNSRIANMLINRTNFQRVLAIYDGATNWSTFGFTTPLVIPSGYSAKIEAQVFGLGETNVFTKFSLQNTPSWNSEIGFNPASVPGLVLWLDAGRGVYTDSGLTTNAVNGSYVKGWADQSGSGNNLTNSLATNIVYSVNGGPNSTPVLLFNGGSTYASTLKTLNSGLNYSQPNYTFIVFWSSGNNGYFWGGGNNNAFVDSANLLKINNGAGLVTYTTMPSGVWRDFVEFQAVGSTQTTVVTNGTYLTPQSAGTSSISSFALGGNFDGTFQLSIKVPEVLVYNAQLSGANLTNVMNYLKTKYSLY